LIEIVGFAARSVKGSRGIIRLDRLTLNPLIPHSPDDALNFGAACAIQI
jgi:hypothetical protein